MFFSSWSVERLSAVCKEGSILLYFSETFFFHDACPSCVVRLYLSIYVANDYERLDANLAVRILSETGSHSIQKGFWQRLWRELSPLPSYVDPLLSLSLSIETSLLWLW